MNKHEFKTALQAISEEENLRIRFSPQSIEVEYQESNRILNISLNNCIQLLISPDLLQYIAEMSTEELKQVKISPMGDLIWESSGEGIAIRSILEGRFGSRKWMEHLHTTLGIPLGEWADSPAKKQEWARAAGSQTSEKKLLKDLRSFRSHSK